MAEEEKNPGKIFVDALEGMSLTDIAHIFHERVGLCLKSMGDEHFVTKHKNSAGFTHRSALVIGSNDDEEFKQKLRDGMAELKNLVKVAKYIGSKALEDDSEVFDDNSKKGFVPIWMSSLNTLMDAISSMASSLEYVEVEHSKGEHYFAHHISGHPVIDLEKASKGNPYHYHHNLMLSTVYPRIDFLDAGIEELDCRYQDLYEAKDICGQCLAGAIVLSEPEVTTAVDPNMCCPFVHPQILGVNRYLEVIERHTGQRTTRIADPITFLLVGRLIWRAVTTDNCCRMSSLQGIQKVPSILQAERNIGDLVDRFLTFIPYMVCGPMGVLYAVDDMASYLKWRSLVVSACNLASHSTSFEILRRNYMMGPYMLERWQRLAEHAEDIFNADEISDPDDQAILMDFGGNELPMLSFYDGPEDFRIHVEAASEALPLQIEAELAYEQEWEVAHSGEQTVESESGS